MDQQQLQKLVKSGRRRPLWTPEKGAIRVGLGRESVQRMLRHRSPFLFVDEVTEVDLHAQAVRGRRRVDPEDPVFRGHFPGEPVYPGVLMLEMIGQFGLCLLHLLRSGTAVVAASSAPERVRALKIHHADFLAEVRPGDELTIVAKVAGSDGLTATCAGQILRGDTICAFALQEVLFVDG